ncbi:hypothetical protein AQ490_24170 [Wenjunlia vitaminophila]|uniref:Uncharacterized protein n=1 Tax=Wenjunlia vitaminophila TaxID=76728 RepID=A0A0T6LS62_WENVI|nr:hypothetical protein [Wenjunlia vitaminophila]KRV48636.1 hypothetical protein AQ490_24170 [Wenjunlia vitaminophila]
MRVHVAHEPDGRVVALAESDSGDGGLSVRLLPMDGREVTEIDVPEEFAGLSLSELHARLRMEPGPSGMTVRWQPGPD